MMNSWTSRAGVPEELNSPNRKVSPMMIMTSLRVLIESIHRFRVVGRQYIALGAMINFRI